MYFKKMAGGAGHIYDMIARMRSNNNLLNKPGYFKMREAYIKITKKEAINYRKASPEELRHIRMQLIKQRRLEFVRMVTVIALTVIISITLFVLATLHWRNLI